MKIATKRLVLRLATTVAVACTAALILLPGAASAAVTATAKGSVNVYERARTSSDVVDTLYNGESVAVQGCRQGWCYITHTGPDGFVPATSLRRGNNAMDPNFNLTFNFPQGSFTIGTGGVSIGIGNPKPPKPAPHANDVCFFSGSGYTGDSFCVDRGAAMAYVGSRWNNRISSFRNPSGLTVRVCDDAGYDGLCRTYTTSASSLGSLDNRISSIRVR